MKVKNEEIDSLFATPIADIMIDDEELMMDIERETYRLMEEYPEGQPISNYGGWQTPRDCWWNGDSVVYEKLGEQILPLIKDYYYNTMKNNRTDELKVQSVWGNVANRGSYNSVHVHPSSQVSAVLYIKGTNESGDIIFYNPLGLTSRMLELSCGDMEEYTPYNQDRWFVTPMRGRLLIFPSYIPHAVQMNNNDDDRISIAMNFNIPLL
tara:strand:+ start:1140 stop:1766 length:627 start_codon:yes stop_codon:yes gene_type:complete